MARCPFATWMEISGPVGSYLAWPFRIVHHTTEGSSAQGAFSVFRAKKADPHFTVDANGIYQHIDTSLSARALKNQPGGVQTNRHSAVQIELVGFAHRLKNRQALTHLARLCRWLERTHGIPRSWPNGVPKPSVNGRDPGGHNRNAQVWATQGGHYGHCHVPENNHWDPGYSPSEVDFLMNAEFDENGAIVNEAALIEGMPGPEALEMQPDGGPEYEVSTMPGHFDEVEDRVRAKPHQLVPILGIAAAVTIGILVFRALYRKDR